MVVRDTPTQSPGPRYVVELKPTIGKQPKVSQVVWDAYLPLFFGTYLANPSEPLDWKNVFSAFAFAWAGLDVKDSIQRQIRECKVQCDLAIKPFNGEAISF